MKANVRKMLLLMLISNFFIASVFADDTGGFAGGFSGGSTGGSTGGGGFSSGGTGASSSLGGFGGASVATTSATNTANSANVMVPAIQANSQSNNATKAAADLLGQKSQQYRNDIYTPSNFVSTNSKKQDIETKDPFERNVYVRTGLKLDKYGVGLISSPMSFAPTQNIPVPSNYVVGPGDQLTVQLNGAVNDDFSGPVGNDGTIYVPKLGAVNVTGVKSDQLGGYLKQKLSKIYRNFEVNSNVGSVRSIQITVAGMAAQPGTYTLSSLSTLSNAVVTVGGPSNVGSFRDIELKRNGHVIAHFDLYELLINGNQKSDVNLLAGDIIQFKPVGNEVAIYNGVKRQAIYETKPGETLKDIVDFAGGMNSEANDTNVFIENTDSSNTIEVNSFPWSQAQNNLVKKNEIIHFLISKNQYINSVAVIGNVADPTRVPYKPGMTVKDLIPNKEALLTSSYYDAVAYGTYGQDNALSQKRVEKTMQSITSDDSSLVSPTNDGTAAANQQNIFAGGQNTFRAGPVTIPEANINWSYALVVRQDLNNYSSHIIPFNLKKAIEGDLKNNLKLKPGDVINVLSTKDVRTPSAGGHVYVFIDGEITSPGVYELKAGQTVKDLIESAGGVTPKSYIFGMELARDSVKKQQRKSLDTMLDMAQQTLLAQASTAAVSISSQSSSGGNTTQLVLQQQNAFIDKMRQITPTGRIVLNLGSYKASVNDIPNVALENGDTVYIPPLPDVVHLIGQVYNPATFIYNERYSVRKYINLAGDENPYADSSQEYVLRADGSIYSRQQAGWFGGFDNRSLNPGDVIIIPQQIQLGSNMQLVLNITQILANTAQTLALFSTYR